MTGVLISTPILTLALTLALALVASSKSNATGGVPAPRVPFDEAVATILRVRCVRCHGPAEESGGLRLDDYDAVMRGGERGPVVVPGNPKSSLLIRKVLRRDKPAMPPRKALPQSEIRRIRAWIESGAGP